MKANQKFVNAEDAVSPVIAVILMVAITVVLAASVFVLVNDLGKNVGTTGPSLGMVSDATGSSTSKWTVKLSSATQSVAPADYRFVFTTPSHGTIVATPSPTDTEFTEGYEMWSIDDPTTGRSETSETDMVSDDAAGYRLTWSDIDGNAKWSVGDTLVIEYTDDPGAAQTTYGTAFAGGTYQVELLHISSGTAAGSLPRSF